MQKASASAVVGRCQQHQRTKNELSTRHHHPCDRSATHTTRHHLNNYRWGTRSTTIFRHHMRTWGGRGGRRADRPRGLGGGIVGNNCSARFSHRLTVHRYKKSTLHLFLTYTLTNRYSCILPSMPPTVKQAASLRFLLAAYPIQTSPESPRNGGGRKKLGSG